MTDSEVRLVNDATALLSMRESDFDAYSAYGEVVDNAIQAEADSISIRVEKESSSRGYEVIKSVAFGDNGHGMDAEVLHRCLQLGYSTRFNDRTGIGRFGVGMTLAAINQCRRVEIYSKVEGAGWLWTHIDLDDIVERGYASIAAPEAKDPSCDLAKLAGAKSGTIVVWEQYDRQPESAGVMTPKTREWLGRTYRHFIWDDDLSIKLDGTEVFAIDPLYLRWDRTMFPDDPPGLAFDPFELEWPVPRMDRAADSPDEATVQIRMSLVHANFRAEKGAGGNPAALARFLHHNEGISILRNRREVFYGHVPYWPGTRFVEIDRWWGCEIRFDAVLDRAFTVKNIKRGAVPNTELKRAIYEQIRPTRKTCVERVREQWRKAEREKRAEAEEDGLTTGHEDAERAAKKTPTDTSAIDSGKDRREEGLKLVDELKQGLSDERKAAWIAKWSSQPFTIHDDAWKSPEFFEAVHLGGSDVLRFNTQHVFFEELYALIDGLEETAEEYHTARTLKTLIDLVLISYSKAEAKFDKDDSFTAEQFVELLRLNWGQYLQSYLRTWRDEREE